VIHDKAAVAVKPRPELLPFFRVVTEKLVTTPYKMEHWRKRRGSVPLLRDDVGNVWLPESRVNFEDSRSSRRTLSPDTVDRIRHLSGDGLALRAIAREIGVSHETVRTVLKA
jgi:hypothetical protein